MKTSFLLLFAAALSAAETAPIRGFSPLAARAQHEREAKLRAIPSAERMRSHARRMAGEPHLAGTPGSKAVAEYALGVFREAGLDARIEIFEALLPQPVRRAVELVQPVRFQARLREPAVAEDPDSADANQVPAFHAYSGNGEVTAPLVYVNYGLREDYERLRKAGVEVKGKIVIARYGRGWRGTKPKLAAENGAVGCIVYSDPRDDGYFQGDVYPRGPFRPPDGVQRGSVMDMPLYVGDPLSPGWASEPGSRRLPVAEAGTLMRIPVLPVSYRDAQPLLEHLGGPVAPEAWRGALPITYHLGPGPATVRLAVELDNATRPVYNVIARMTGAAAPEEWIVYGNHHDAWVNGAQDPVSGAAAVLETARSLAELRSREGWRPARTLVFALWDAEEFGLVGSTEWAEKHARELSAKGVAYLNTDSNSRGRISASASPTLHLFLREVLRDVQDPRRQRSVLEAAGRLAVGALGAGSDYVAFSHHLGIPSLNIGFDGDPGGIYHSIYDTNRWYEKFSDGDFAYGRTLAQIMATMLARLAGGEVLPFEFGNLAAAVAGQAQEINKLDGAEAKLSWAGIRARLAKISTLSDAFNGRLALHLSAEKRDPAVTARMNRILLQAERALLLPEGLPGRPWYKHQLSAPGLHTGYSAKTLPAIREAAETGRWAEAREGVQAVSRVLDELIARLEEL